MADNKIPTVKQIINTLETIGISLLFTVYMKKIKPILPGRKLSYTAICILVPKLKAEILCHFLYDFLTDTNSYKSVDNQPFAPYGTNNGKSQSTTKTLSISSFKNLLLGEGWFNILLTEINTKQKGNLLYDEYAKIKLNDQLFWADKYPLIIKAMNSLGKGKILGCTRLKF